MRVLIFGCNGQLGAELMRSAPAHGVQALGVGRPECNITRITDVRRIFRDAGPTDLVINAAAFTAVDLAEQHADKVFAVNRDGAGNLAEACRAQNTPLIHISTDYVFEGLIARPLKPSDAVNPRGVYAQSKAEGEDAVRNRINRHLIIRTSWLYGRHGSNFVKTMLRLGREKECIRVVDDQVGSPTYACDLARALFEIAARLTPGSSDWGTYHYCNQGALTWYAFARRIFALARPHETLAVKQVVPILTTHYPTPAPRPHYSVLDCSSLDATFGIARRPWDEALKEMIMRLFSK
ncbi:MAG: dTDP-4-dehydrorhamnose reductase [Desulfobacteraceae bacterium]